MRILTAQITERILAPYSLVCKSSVWYLLAERDKELRTYRVTRMHSVRLLDETFIRRPDFDLPTYWRAQAQNFENLPLNVVVHFGFTLSVYRLSNG